MNLTRIERLMMAHRDMRITMRMVCIILRNPKYRLTVYPQAARLHRESTREYVRELTRYVA